MSTVKIKYDLGKDAIRRIAVETGSIPSVHQVLDVDLEALTPEQRALIMDACEGGSVTLLTLKPYAYATLEPYPWFVSCYEAAYVLTTEDVLAKLAVQPAEMQACRDENSKLCEAENSATLARVQEYLATPSDDYQAGSLIRARAFPGALHEETQAAIQASLEKYNRALAISRERQEREKAEADAQRQAEQAERLAWAKLHGSEQLRRGLEAGHTCSRLYWVERAAVEYAGYVLDFEKSADWKDRACPSIAALDERDAVLAAHPDVKATIVWLTSEPHDKKAGGDEYEDEPFVAREAVVVNDPRYDKYLVKSL